MNFRSIADLQHIILTRIHTIPPDVDIVVGIARSGMLPATMIALALNVPLAEMTTFSAGTILGMGRTRRVKRMELNFADVRHALIVDDSSDTGASIQEARATLSPIAGAIKMTFCAIYGRPGISVADLTFEQVPHPRVFEWNVMHHSLLERSCVDIDGILCHDPSADENDDGAAYLAFLEQARTRLLPTKAIGTLVTSRLEKYRPQTETWLKKHGISYGSLIMLDLPDAATRRKQQAHGTFKGGYYRKSTAELFIESELNQAVEIARISGKPVLSMEGPIMCYPNDLSAIAALQRVRRLVEAKRYRSLAGRIAKRLLGEHAEMMKKLIS